MNQEIKQEWLRRLKSGEYKQGEDYLHKGDKHCCLGVLADMAVEAGVCHKELNNGGQVWYYDGCGEIHAETLIPAILKWSGLEGNGKLTTDLHKIMYENDDYCDGKYTTVIPLIEAIEC